MKTKTRNRLILILWICVFAPFVIGGLSLLLVYLTEDIPTFERLEEPESALATQLISFDGKTLCTIHSDENRTLVSYSNLPQHLVDAAVATEDVRFYDHSGIDLKSLFRVGVKSLLLGDTRSGGGGSTISQQLAKALFKRQEGGKIALIKDKLKEWIIAVKLERSYTKNEIINMYLNTVFFGSNSYGIKAAAQTFFAKDPSELNVQESATLVGMLNKPTRYNPAINPEKSLTRRNHVLSQMNKYGYLEDRAYDSIVKLPIELNYHVQNHNAGHGLYFKDMLLRVMKAEQPRRRDYRFEQDYLADLFQWENDPLYGWLNKNRKSDGKPYNLYEDGLKIYTTIDYSMQKYAEEAVEEHLGGTLQKTFDRHIRNRSNWPFASEVSASQARGLVAAKQKESERYRLMKRRGCTKAEIEKKFNEKTEMRVFAWNWKGYTDTVMTPNDSIRYYKSILKAAFVAIEPRTGYMKAYVGGPDYTYFKWDNARQSKRQVGSTIKPFLYTLAMQEGFSPCDKVQNVPQTFIVGDDEWTPRSTDKAEWIGKTVTLKWGLTKSSNNITAYLMKQFGPEAMVDMCRKMGITSHLDAVPALCLGPCDLTLFEMVAAYNTFPSRGVHVTPLLVTRIEDKDGNVLGTFNNIKREAISEKTAYLMANLMQGVVNEGTAIRLKYRYGMTGEIAGKTGTANDQTDGWFIGYTPKITAGVWVGADDKQVHFESLSLGGGSNMALPIWGLFMQKVLSDGTLGISPSDRFAVPQGVNIDFNCTGSDEDIESSESDADSVFDY